MNDTTCLVDGKYGIADLVDLVELRSMFEHFTEATGFTIGFLDHPGMNVLIATGWRDICIKFHRTCPVSFANCTQSNRHLLDSLDEPGKLIIEECENGLVDCAFPIIVKGKHIASLATGQLLLKKPDLDRFRRQAKCFGLDEQEYLRALDEVPVVSEEVLRSVTTFLGEMALVLSQLGYAHLVIKEDARRLEKEIIARKLTEEALRQSEEHYRRLFDLGTDAIIVVDVETLSLLDVNTTAETLYGYTREELLQKKATDLSAEPEEAQALIQQGDGIVHIPRRRHCKKDGTVFYVDISGRFFIFEEKRMMLTVLRDISDTVRADAEHQRLEEELQQAQKLESVGRLAGGVAHDFNNMLGVILGYTEMALEEAPEPHPLHASLREISTAAKRSADLTRQLLAFARKQAIAPRVLDLNETVAGTIGMIQRLIGENIRLHWRPAAIPWLICVDPSQIDQILTNLCANARDAIHNVGTITIETETIVVNPDDCLRQAGAVPGAFVCLSVSDDGCGMETETIAHIFEPFYTTKGVGQGLGLGLATVYGVAKQNNGFVIVESQVGKGTTFRIYLPRYTGEIAPELSDSTPHSVMHGNEIILLVEDEPNVLIMTVKALEKRGYTVLKASSPGEAIRIAREHSGKIHLLLTDVVMPEMNGRELAKKLVFLHPAIKRLFMSGYTADVMAHHGVIEEKIYFIQKPFSMHDLAAKVREVLDAG